MKPVVLTVAFEACRLEGRDLQFEIESTGK